MPLAHALEVNALTLDDADGPELTRHLVLGAGAAARRRRCAIWREGWFRALEALVRHAAQPGAGGRTPSRSAAGGAHRRPRSSGWSSTYPQIEDILPLSPLQEGLLFHALYDAQAPDVYTVQLVLGLAGRARQRRAAGGGAGAGATAMPACAPASGTRA